MKKSNLNTIEDLFRKSLEESEVTPGEQLSGKIMRKVGRKEFVRFNPSRFNVWYLGGIAAACAVSGVVLFSNAGNKSTNQVSPKAIITDTARSDSSTNNIFLLNDSIKPTAAPVTTPNQAANKITHRQKSPALHENTSIIKTSEKQKQRINVVSESVEAEGLPVLTAGMQVSVNSGCVPLYVKFTSISSGNILQEWNFGDGGTSDKLNPEWVYDIPGVYKVILYAKDADGRKATTSLNINVLPKPKAAFDILPENPEIPANEITFANESTGGAEYTWYFGDGSTSQLFAPVHKYTKQGKYNVTLVAVSENGCIDSLSVPDAFSETDCYIRFPNAFVPNKGGPVGGYYSRLTDNNNMVFHPVYSGVVDFNLRIYSKQGHMVFESDDVYLGWDGYYQGQLCTSGVYVWKAEGKFRNGESYVVSGDLTLVNY
jgi:hypothetical protein